MKLSATLLTLAAATWVSAAPLDASSAPAVTPDPSPSPAAASSVSATGLLDSIFDNLDANTLSGIVSDIFDGDFTSAIQALQDNVSPQCRGALFPLLIPGTPLGQCFNTQALLPLLIGQADADSAFVTSYVNGVCAAPACSPQTLQPVTDRIKAACGADLARFQIPTSAVDGIVGAYPAARAGVCAPANLQSLNQVLSSLSGQTIASGASTPQALTPGVATTQGLQSRTLEPRTLDLIRELLELKFCGLRVLIQLKLYKIQLIAALIGGDRDRLGEIPSNILCEDCVVRIVTLFDRKFPWKGLLERLEERCNPEPWPPTTSYPPITWSSTHPPVPSSTVPPPSSSPAPPPSSSPAPPPSSSPAPPPSSSPAPPPSSSPAPPPSSSPAPPPSSSAPPQPSSSAPPQPSSTTPPTPSSTSHVVPPSSTNPPTPSSTSSPVPSPSTSHCNVARDAYMEREIERRVAVEVARIKKRMERERGVRV